jgi:hypothetical protein
VIVRLQRLRLWWDDAFWLIPLLGVFIAIRVQQLLADIDEQLAARTTLDVISPSAA